MKLLITLDFPPAVGGIQKYLYTIAKYRYTENDTVFAASKNLADRLTAEIPPKVTYFYTFLTAINLKLNLLKMIVPYTRMCNRHKGKLEVQCGNVYSAIIPWLISRFINQPYSVFTYGTELLALNRDSLKNKLLKRVLAGAEKIVTISEYTKSILVQLGFTQGIDIIHPRLEPTEIRHTTGRKETGSFNVLSVGRLVRHKGYMNLIPAAKKLLEKDPEFRFTILGNGPLYSTLKEMCKRLGVESRVSIKRGVSDEVVLKEFDRAHLFVLPSIETSRGVEGFGIVLLEAMACRIPIVASASGGIPEVLDKGSCGVLVEPGHVEQLAEAIDHIKNNPVDVKRYTENAHKRLMDSYVWK